MHSEELLVAQFTSLDSKIYLKPNLGVKDEPCVQNRIFFSLIPIPMQFKKLWRYDRFDMKTKTLKIMNCI